MKTEEIYVETVSFFLNSRANRIPNPTNQMRKNIFNDVTSGIGSIEIYEKYGKEKGDPTQYLNKIIVRIGQYTGFEKGLGLRAVRRGAKKLHDSR